MIEIPNYKVTNVIYKNENTITYQALRKTDQQRFILKTQTSEFPSLKEISKLQHEYEIIKDLKCDCIISVQEIIRHQNRLFLVLEDLNGKTLEQILQERHLFNFNDFLSVAIHLASALEKLHENEIIHKDIKPSNILLDSNWNLRLIDFSISSKLSFETQNMVNPNILEGSLSYLSPEQTGRMNRIVDQRSDFYSLGVVFYQMLTGKCPFESLDPLELIYAHLAKFPAPIHEINSNVPPIMSSIVQKLMAKSADDRYSSAYGIKMDLLKLKEGITSFPIGEQDKKNRLHVSQTLYGRDNEIQELLSIFKKVCDSGKSELALVAGNSGVGKSAFIGEVYTPLSKEKGYFIDGKFDLLQRTEPYTAFIHAFKKLISQLLANPEDKLLGIKKQILEALGPNAGVIIEFLPELGLIIGLQPPAIKLPPIESQNRFNYVFGQFISVFADKEHPLVIFLDDLQWADQSSLNLIEYFLPKSSKYIFMTGAYRSNEVGQDHILRSTLDNLKNSGVSLTAITLEPISQKNVRELLVDTFKEANVDDLADLVFEKTRGNPFFINELLKTLYTEKILYFLEGTWHWNKDLIIAKKYSSNVVELMVANIQKLSKPTQETLTMAACIGAQFDLKTLSIICQKKMHEIAPLIWEAMKAGLVVNLDGSYKEALIIPEDSQEVIEYKFLHDRVQEAAYKLIPKEKSQELHLQIGKLLLQNQGEQNLFAIVSHFNEALNLFKSEKERINIARLNLKAAEKAKASIAYKEALTFANAGLSLLPPNSWNENYYLSFQLKKEAAENKMLLKRHEESEKDFFELIKASQDTLDKADVYNLLITLYSIDKQVKGVDYSLEILNELGVRLPKHVTQWDVLFQFLKLQFFIYITPKKKWANLPTMTSPKLLKISDLLNNCLYCAVFLNPLLYSLASLKLAELHFRYGFTKNFIYSFTNYLAVLVNIFYAFKTGKYWLEKVLPSYFARLHHIPTTYYLSLSYNIGFWYHPAPATLEYAKKGLIACVENGDLNYYPPLLLCPCWLKYFGVRLGELLETFKFAEIEAAKAVGFYDAIQFAKHIAEVEMGKISYDQNVIDEFVTTRKSIVIWISTAYLMTSACFYTLSNYEMALQFIKKYEPIEEGNRVFCSYQYGKVFQGLILVAHYKNMTFLERFSARRKLKKLQKYLKMCAKQQSFNFSPHYYLISAEIASLGNNLTKTLDLYNQATAYSLKAENLQFAAISSESAAKFLLRLNQPKLAKSYMQEAHYYFIRYEAFAKVKILEETYPQWFKEGKEEAAFADTFTSTTKQTGNLDYLSIIKSTQALSSEIILNKLLEKLMRILLENAGAQRGLLMLEREGQMFIEAEGHQEEIFIKDQTIEERTDIPISLIFYVQRTKESVVLTCASKDPKFSQDPYIQKAGLKSVICSPILYQNKIMGFIYLENNSTENAFTKDRIEILNILSSQAAISLENARLYVASGKFVPIEFLQLLKKKKSGRCQIRRSYRE